MKSWFFLLVAETNLSAPPAEKGILADSFLRFRAGHPPSLEIWAAGCPRLAHHPPVVSPEPDPRSRGLWMVKRAGF